MVGQKFIPSVLSKISQLRSLLDQRGLSDVRIEVDGGINATTASKVVASGADVLVAGSAIFGEADRKAALEAIRNGAAGALDAK